MNQLHQSNGYFIKRKRIRDKGLQRFAGEVNDIKQNSNRVKADLMTVHSRFGLSMEEQRKR